MTTRHLLRPVQALVLAGAATLAAHAYAAPPATPATPAPTLVRLELSPLDTSTALTAALESCASLVKSGRLGDAQVACDHAVRSAQVERAESASSPLGYRPGQELAVAYNNRAVLHYLRGELALAAADSARALAIAPSRAIESTAAFIDAARTRVARNEG